jgi:hypothetical protein
VSAHTPGPWFVSQDLGHAVCVVATTRIAADAMPAQDMAADARLIAAAPRMFAVIERGAAAGDAECISIVDAVISAQPEVK